MLNSGNKVNAITLVYILKQGLRICYTNIKSQKIDGSIFEIFQIVLASFQVEDTLKKILFFLKSRSIS